mmetsp:Transcript_176737/g.566856  ORF Transcript_176737/g.566856 Transcript_176737/m.566856 type:complete len:221 (+) Transcript_176737:1393-2055(+)
MCVHQPPRHDGGGDWPRRLGTRRELVVRWNLVGVLGRPFLGLGLASLLLALRCLPGIGPLLAAFLPRCWHLLLQKFEAILQRASLFSADVHGLQPSRSIVIWNRTESNDIANLEPMFLAISNIKSDVLLQLKLFIVWVEVCRLRVRKSPPAIPIRKPLHDADVAKRSHNGTSGVGRRHSSIALTAGLRNVLVRHLAIACRLSPIASRRDRDAVDMGTVHR